jgi:Methane oxygenase PmoA
MHQIGTRANRISVERGLSRIVSDCLPGKPPARMKLLLRLCSGAFVAAAAGLAVCVPAAAAAGPATGVTLTRLPDRVRIEIDGRLFSEYVFTGAKRPYLYPVLASDGTPLTRDFPMKDPPGEDHDHPHHRSLWFAHSSVNGIDFWNEGKAGGSGPKGTIVHDTLVEARGGAVGVIRASDRWLAPGGDLVCTDDTTIRVQGGPRGPMLDYEVTLHAPPGGPLLFGDNKDGVMGMRLAQWMTLPHKYQDQDLPGAGHFVTGAGQLDAAAWGKRADWCDAYAPHNGKVYGVAIFDNPENLRHPTWWMARDYGLFGANPFGRHDYENLKDNPHAGDYTVPAGGSLTLRYRFVFHEGDTVAAGIAGLYRDYAAGR